MSDEQNEATPVEGGAGAKGGTKALIVAILLGLGGGATVGMTTLGDAVGPVLAERAQSAGSDGHGGGGHGGGGEEAAIHVIDNLVVNPARSGGQRFLLTSIAVEPTEPGLIETVRAHDVEIRASLILVLGAKSTEELSDIENRPAVVAELRAAIVEILGAQVVQQIYVPQFVIQ